MFHPVMKGFVLVITKEANGHFQSALTSVWVCNLKV